MENYTVKELKDLCQKKKIQTKTYWRKKDYITALEHKNNSNVFDNNQNAYMTFEPFDPYQQQAPYQQQFNYVGGREQVQKNFNQYMNKYNRLYQKSQQQRKKK